ncbi:MAG: hypothetical protein CM1200mP20_02360 [Pseudomonadota bacterium]|nr:MAG: hypothetical protein CM1200mP20_02360 [Pseudomonadota bacterium]
MERSPGGGRAILEAANLLSDASFPVILNGAGVVLSGAIDSVRAWRKKSTRRYVAIINTMTHLSDRTDFLPDRWGITDPRLPWN